MSKDFEVLRRRRPFVEQLARCPKSFCVHSLYNRAGRPCYDTTTPEVERHALQVACRCKGKLTVKAHHQPSVAHADGRHIAEYPSSVRLVVVFAKSSFPSFSGFADAQSNHALERTCLGRSHSFLPTYGGILFPVDGGPSRFTIF